MWAPWKECCSKRADFTRLLVPTCVHECGGVYVFKSQSLAKKKQFNEVTSSIRRSCEC